MSKKYLKKSLKMSQKWLKTSKNVLTTSTKPLKMSKNHQNNVNKWLYVY